MNRMKKFLLAVTLVTTLAAAGTVSAQTVRTLNLAAYPNGTLVSAVNEPGFSFTAATPGNVTVQNGNLIVVGNNSNADLTIAFTGGATSSTFTYSASGSCQVPGFDVFKRQQVATIVNTFTSFVAGGGRCQGGTNTVAVVHDRLVVDVSSNDQENLSSISYIQAAPAPVPTMSEWAMILFGLILAGGAALYVQRRQFAA